MKLILLANLLCFSFIISSEDSKCDVDIKKRIDCGYYGISKEKCLSRGCCVEQTSLTEIWCFHSKEEEIEEDDKETKENVEDEYEEEEEGEEKEEKEINKRISEIDKIIKENSEKQKKIDTKEEIAKEILSKLGLMLSPAQIVKNAKKRADEQIRKRKIFTR